MDLSNDRIDINNGVSEYEVIIEIVRSGCRHKKVLYHSESPGILVGLEPVPDKRRSIRRLQDLVHLQPD